MTARFTSLPRAFLAFLLSVSLLTFFSPPIRGQEEPPPEEGAAATGGEAGAETTGGEAAEGEKDAAAEAEPEEEENNGAEGEDEVDYSKIQVGEFAIFNNNPGQPRIRKETRDPQLWRFFMHGVADFFAKPVPWSQVFGGEQDPARWLDPATVVRTPVKVSPMPSLKLGAGQSLFLDNALIPSEELDELKGTGIRVFVWMQATDAGMGGDLWNDPPGMDLVRIGLDGRAVQTVPASMKTRGTFPWHCYYSDIWVPRELGAPEGGSQDVSGTEVEDAEGDGEKSAPEKYRSKGVYIRLFNPVGGTVWFSNLSWEKLTAENTYDLMEKQDPITGSMAPNPQFDELPLHLCWGQGQRYRWQFLLGRQGGAAGIPDLSSVAGFKNYYLNTAKKDVHHLLLGVRNLADWYHHGSRLGLLPAFQEKWLQGVREVIVADQDEASGLWGYEGSPKSVAVTYAFVEGLFGATRIRRTDRKPISMPWRAFSGGDVPRALQIADTVLGMQASVEPGSREKAGWGLFAYDFREEGELEPPVRCSLAATANAMYLLRLCSPHLGRSYQSRVKEAIGQATDYVLKHCLTPSGLWRQSDVEARVTSPAFMPQLIEATYLLERRTVISLKSPVVEVPPVVKKRFSITWKDPDSAAVSLRVYAPPKDVLPEDLDEQHLVGIIQRTGEGLLEQDPLLMVRTMRNAAKDFWGLPWSGGLLEYTVWKMGLLREDLVVANRAEELTVKLEDPQAVALYVETANAKGECSRPVKVPFTVREPLPGEDDEEEGEGEGEAEGGEAEEEEEDDGGAAW